MAGVGLVKKKADFTPHFICKDVKYEFIKTLHSKTLIVVPL